MCHRAKRGSRMAAVLLTAIALLAISALLAASASAYQLGTQSNFKTVVLLLKFNNESTPSTTIQQLKDQVFLDAESVHQMMIESSWGSTGLTGIQNVDGDVFGYIEIPHPKPANDCMDTSSTLTDGVDAVAQQQGIDLPSYDRIVYVLPACPSSFNLGSGGRAWIFQGQWQGRSGTGIISHEMSHSFAPGIGVIQGHANGISCTDGPDGSIPAPLAEYCRIANYADFMDYMGGGGLAHIPSVFHRVSWGLLPQSASQDITTEGVYDIYKTAESPQAGRAYNLRIPLSNESVLKDLYNNELTTPHYPSYINLEYRRPYGTFDQTFINPTITEGAQIRVSRDFGQPYAYNAAETFLVDTDAHTSPFVQLLQLQGIPVLADYNYTSDNSFPDHNRFEALTVDSGLYDEANDVLLRVTDRTSDKLTVQYSHGLLSGEKTAVDVSNRILTVTARAGYANDVYMRADGNGNVTVRDGNAPVLAGAACAGIGKNVASCAGSGFDRIVVNTGDRRDYVDANVAGKPVSVYSGAGDDVIFGGTQDTVVDAGEGSDVIRLSTGADVVVAGSGMDDVSTGGGNDSVIGLDGDADTVICGDGTDDVEAGIGDNVDASTCESAAGLRDIAAVTPPSGTHSLTNEGLVDWSHWGRNAVGDWDHMSSGGAQVSNLMPVTPSGATPATTLTRLTSSVAPTVSWTGGTPTASSSGTATGVANTQSGLGRGVSLTVANVQNSETMTLRLHAGVQNTTGRLELFWASNPGSVVSNATVTAGSTVVNRIFQITLRPPQATDTLNVRFLQDTTSGSGKVRVYSASLSRLAAIKSTAPAAADLSALGSLDWAHWGTTSASLTQAGKSGATEIQAPAIKVGSGTVTQATATTNPVTTSFGWANGDSPTSHAGTQTGISTGGATARGFSFTVPAASANKKTLKLYVGVTNTTGKLDLFWGSNAIPVLTDTSVSNASGTTNAVYTIDLRHITAGTTLKVQLTQGTSASTGRVILQSAALY